MVQAQTVAEAVAQAEGMQPASGAIEVGEAVQVKFTGDSFPSLTVRCNSGTIHASQGIPGLSAWCVLRAVQCTAHILQLKCKLDMPKHILGKLCGPYSGFHVNCRQAHSKHAI